MYGIFYICPVSVGPPISQFFIYIFGYLDVRKISEMMDFRTFVVPLPYRLTFLTFQSDHILNKVAI